MKNSPNEKVSIVTAFYCGNQYIPRLAESIRRNVATLQEHGVGLGVEWVIVNDSPQEPVMELPSCKGLQTVVLSNPSNMGIHATRVHGLDKAGGRYVLIIDQDDEIADDFLLVMHEATVRHPDADVIVCNELVEREDGESHKLYPKASDLARVSDLPYYLNVTNPIQTPGQCLVKVSSIPEGWKSNALSASGSDDLLLWIMLLARGAVFFAIPQCLFVHHFTGKNLSDSSDAITQSSHEVADFLLRQGFTTPAQDRQLRKSISLGYAPSWRRLLNVRATLIKVRYKLKSLVSDPL